MTITYTWYPSEHPPSLLGGEMPKQVLACIDSQDFGGPSRYEIVMYDVYDGHWISNKGTVSNVSYWTWLPPLPEAG